MDNPENMSMSRNTVNNAKGWLTGVEPATSCSTDRCSAIELQPPYENDFNTLSINLQDAS